MRRYSVNVKNSYEMWEEIFSTDDKISAKKAFSEYRKMLMKINFLTECDMVDNYKSTVMLEYRK